MTVRILQGDCRDVLRTLPDASVHCVVTSPPYWGLRDYGVEGQIGLEASVHAWVAEMVAVFSEVHRVLRDDGTLWLNLGDSYAGSRCGGDTGKSSIDGSTEAQDAAKDAKRRMTESRRRDNAPIPRSDIRCAGIKPKEMIGQPWRVAFALSAAGWYLRQDIIWSKPTPMPESVSDRCTKAHEYLFLLAKSPRYWFDADAFAEPRVSMHDAGVAGWAHGDVPHDLVTHNRDKGNAKTFRGGQYTNGNKFDNSHANNRDSTGNAAANKTTRNRRSVWEIATQPFAGSHFATFPPALIEPCILAGCPKGGVVLDPFGGAGTTGMVADRHGRDAILIELNPDYAAMAQQRIVNDAPMFAKVATA
ncbi:MAG: site-specific DNA-methyltransferase [Rudaea sp.]|nr:site-specific DNA-methyltransferase [Rudaea sp.]